MDKQNDFIQFEEYYENSNHSREGGQDLNENNEDDYCDEVEREEMENDYQLVKSLSELKDKNKRLESQVKYQQIKIDSLENEMEKALNELRLKDAELEDFKSKGTTPSDYKKASMQAAQISNLNLQLEKYKTMLSDKKSEFSGLLEKYNDLQKNCDHNIMNEKKLKQEIISKDKQIARLLEELDKKNTNTLTPSNTKSSLDKENERLNNELKKMERQKNDLYVAFKKSLKLCSILKRQKVHLENARLLTFTEEEFKQLLDQNK